MHYTYHTKGTCASSISFDLDGDILRNVQFCGGCNGNLKAISALVDGMHVQDLVEKVKGIRCGLKQTSCSDQLATAVLAAYEQSKESATNSPAEDSQP